jgi:hypothetical protein
LAKKAFDRLARRGHAVCSGYLEKVPAGNTNNPSFAQASNGEPGLAETCNTYTAQPFFSSRLIGSSIGLC